MRVMAVRTLDRPFIDAMFERHRELRSDVGVARITNLGLFLRQQKLRLRRMMNRVAARTDYSRIRVGRPMNIRLRKILRMARKASFENLVRFHLGEPSRNRRLAHARGMLAPCAMTGLAVRTAGLLEMRVLRERSRDIRMARLAWHLGRCRARHHYYCDHPKSNVAHLLMKRPCENHGWLSFVKRTTKCSAQDIPAAKLVAAINHGAQ